MTKNKKNTKAKAKKVVETVVVKKRKNNRKKGGKTKSYAQIGKELGSVVGMPGIGKILGGTIGRIMGRGDYVMSNGPIKANSLISGTTPPSFAGSKNVTTVAHREFIQDIRTGSTLVNGLTTFSSDVFAINPGVFDTFPWLSQVAENYEEYEILGIIFEFRSTSASALNSTNTALGTVIMSTDYNALNPAFTNKQQQENYEFAQSCKPAESAIHAVECQRGLNPVSQLYVRNGPPATGDLRLYDLGNFQISTVGMQATNVIIGELWASYHVAFYKPKLPAVPGVLSDVYTSGPGIDSTHPFGTAVAVGTHNSLGATPAVSAGVLTITFPQNVASGTYMLFCQYGGSSANITSLPSLTATSNCVLLSSGGGGLLNTYTPAAPSSFASGNTPESIVISALVKITGPNALLTFGASWNISSYVSGNWQIWLTQVNSNTPLGSFKFDEKDTFEIVYHK